MSITYTIHTLIQFAVRLPTYLGMYYVRRVLAFRKATFTISISNTCIKMLQNTVKDENLIIYIKISL